MVRRSTNPFTPTFGSMPFALAGRTDLIDDVIEGLANRPGDPNRSTIFIGPRGSGKTVLLRTMAKAAQEQGWVSVNVSARAGMCQELFDGVRVAASRLLPEAVESRLTGLALGPIGVEREMHHERQTSRRFALQSIVEELNNQGIGFLVTIDEIDPHGEELLSFIDMYQHFVADGRDVALLMAGLPGQVSALLIDKNVSFIRRAFQRTLGSISRYEVEESLYSTIVDNGKQIDDDALSMAVEAARGFAFAIQLVGYYLWRASDGHTLITVEDAQHANVLFQRELVRAIVEPTLRELTPRELEYVMAMAEDEGPSSTSAIARRMGISMSNASNLRRRLIERGAITELRHGVVDFDVPMTREYLRTLKG